jgi:hypothetical protein
MNDASFFYRNGIHCLLAKNERSDEWMCFVGFDSSHPLFNVGFHRTKAAPLYRYRSINLQTNNRIWSQLNWLGCSEHPYSEDKTIDLLKNIVDEIAGVQDKPKNKSASDEDMIDAILDMVDLN